MAAKPWNYDAALTYVARFGKVGRREAKLFLDQAVARMRADPEIVSVAGCGLLVARDEDGFEVWASPALAVEQ